MSFFQVIFRPRRGKGENEWYIAQIISNTLTTQTVSKRNDNNKNATSTRVTENTATPARGEYVYYSTKQEKVKSNPLG